MIKFEINDLPFAITNDQLNAVVDLITETGWGLDYDIVEGDINGIIWLWIHHEEGSPTRCWIQTDGDITTREVVDWDWQDTGPERVDLPALYPQKEGEDAGVWTNRILSHSREHEVNRQCSIGWHGECSDRAGESCRCLCHDDATRWFTVEGDAEGGTLTVLRSEQGKQHWPPTEGEPATIWAVWIMGFSADDASARAIKQEEARRG